jgi:hypothetical protein
LSAGDRWRGGSSALNLGDRRGHYWLVIIVVLVALWYAGLLRPTGLAGRTRAEEEKERQQDVVAKWLKKDGDDQPL